MGDLWVTLPAKVRMQDPQIRNQPNPGCRSQEEQWNNVDQWLMGKTQGQGKARQASRLFSHEENCNIYSIIQTRRFLGVTHKKVIF